MSIGELPHKYKTINSLFALNAPSISLLSSSTFFNRAFDVLSHSELCITSSIIVANFFLRNEIAKSSTVYDRSRVVICTRAFQARSEINPIFAFTRRMISLCPTLPTAYWSLHSVTSTLMLRIHRPYSFKPVAVDTVLLHKDRSCAQIPNRLLLMICVFLSLPSSSSSLSPMYTLRPQLLMIDLQINP